ncbi:MAG: tetratricopeptide repeat protein [bacterium]
MKKFLIALICISFSFAYSVELEEAHEKFKENKIDEVMEITEKYTEENPDDAEGWFYLGRYLHYKLYDTGRRGYDEEKSDKVIEYLNKAVSKSDTIGNAYYYLGVEYGVRGHYAFIFGDTVKSKAEFLKGREAKGYPDWMLEYAKNVLNSCAKNAILFGGGDAELNSIWYLQACENYRRDVTAVPTGLLSYPLFVNFIREGIVNYFPPVKTSWTKEQIDSMSVMKLDTAEQIVKISAEIRKKYKLSADYMMKWKLEENFDYNGEKVVMPGTMLLIDLVRENNWERDICFTLGTSAKWRASMNDFLQISGFVLKLTPKILEENEKIDIKNTEKILMNKKSFEKYPEILSLDYPRCSMILANYISVLLQLYEQYGISQQTKKQKGIVKFIKENLDKRGPHLFPQLSEYLDSLYIQYGL